MGVRDTSIKAYKEIVEEGLVSRMEAIVLSTITRSPGLTDREASRRYWGDDRDIREWGSRRNRLYKRGFITSAGKRKCTITGCSAYTWVAKDDLPEQGGLFDGK